MTITTSDNDIKERLSLAYVTAVAAQAGCQVLEPNIDKESVDVIIRPISGQKSQINLQLKATSAPEIFVGSEIKFSLPIKNYDDLRDLKDVNPQYLVVVSLPGQKADWLKMTVKDLIINGGAYYGNLHGLPDVTTATSKTVTFPAAQEFNVEALVKMIQNAPNRIGTAQSV